MTEPERQALIQLSRTLVAAIDKLNDGWSQLTQVQEGLGTLLDASELDVSPDPSLDGPEAARRQVAEEHKIHKPGCPFADVTRFKGLATECTCKKPTAEPRERLAEGDKKPTFADVVKCPACGCCFDLNEHPTCKESAAEARMFADAFPPGEYLQDELNARGWTRQDLVHATGIRRRRIDGLIDGEDPLTRTLAAAIAQAFRQDPETWMNLQTSYDRVCRHREEPADAG